MRKLDADIDMENEINKIRWEQWRAKQKTEREKTCFYCWDNWNNWDNWSDYVPPIIDYVIWHYRSGQSDCQGGTGGWGTAVCMQNALIRWARANTGSDVYEAYSKCYWRRDTSWPEYCYCEEEFNMPVYMVTVWNNSIPWGHAICAEHLGGDMENFDNWQFFQYDNLDIKPGDWDMPCGTDGENTKVDIRRVRTDLLPTSCSSYYPETIVVFEIDKDCNVTCVSQ